MFFKNLINGGSNMKKCKSKFFVFLVNLWNLLSPSKADFKKVIVMVIIFELTALINPYFLKLIIDKISVFKQNDVSIILTLVFLMFLSKEALSIIDYFCDKIIFKILIGVEYYLPIKAQKKLTDLSLSYHENENTGNKIIKIEKGKNKIVDLLADLSWEVIPTFLQLIITCLILIFVQWQFSVSMLLFAPLFIWLTFWVNKKVNPIRKKRYKDNEKASGKMTEDIININTLKSYAREKTEVANFTEIRKVIKNNELREWDYIIKVGLGRNLIIDLGRTMTLLLGTYFIFNSQISIGTFIFVITLSEKAYSSLYRLSRFYDKIEEGKEAVKRFVSLIETEIDIKNPENGFVPDNLIGEIEFNNLNFSYNGSKNKALSNINLQINPRSVTALVGPSGGGKTTLARMIYRHYDPKNGEVLVDGKDLREYDLYELRKFMAIVPQEVEVFNRSISDNIAYAKPEASPEEIQAVAKIANAHEFIEKLEDGYNTKIGERGVKLSGGQRQRLGIARALLVNPRILIFDEATSSLDSHSEKLIQDAMEKISHGRTTILIAHRLSTIRKADKIVVIENGMITETGSHADLCKNKKGIYTKLLNLQKIGNID